MQSLAQNVQTRKMCGWCRRCLPANTQYFYRCTRYLDGLNYYCKVCQNEKVEIAREKKRQPKPEKNMSLKTCPRCKRTMERDAYNFHKHKSRHDGLASHCKDCQR